MQIKMDVSAVREIERELAHIRNGANRAMSRAINHTLNVTRTEASKEIRGQVKLSAAYVRERLRIIQANVTKPQGRISTPRRGMLLSQFPHREYARGGIGVQVKPSGGKKRMPGAFYMDLPAGTDADGNRKTVRAIVYRPRDPSQVNWHNAGLRVTRGPSLSQAFTDVKDDLQAPSAERLLSRMNHEAERLLNRQ